MEREVIKIEIHMSDGKKLFLEDNEARRWTELVDWGLRKRFAEEIEKYGKIKSEKFDWKEE